MGDTLSSQIQDAIKTASVHVAIFSPHYAESRWCLEELHLMVQSGKPIIPVFYKIEPGELKRTDGVYAAALRILAKKRKRDDSQPLYNSTTSGYWLTALYTVAEAILSIVRGNSQPRYNSTTIGNWRTALYTVAEISGLELDKFNRDEGELVDAVVDSVRGELRGTGRLDVAEHPTGLDDKIEDFEKKVQLKNPGVQSKKPRVIGIVGMGGIGKTTLVKELFNRKKSQYSKSCFLADVRENARKASLESLQEKLLRRLTTLKDEKIKIESESEGIELLKNRLKSFEALVILDDVDHMNQLEALLKPIRDVLHSNSLILITSRDRYVLRKSKLVEESSIYLLTGLNPQQSRELFCWHAFTRPHPLPGFEDLVEKYLKACNDLPLSLKVFGGLLYGDYEESFWKDQLERLEQKLPEDIITRLQVSYDLLQDDEKIIFLDISCFFIGERRDKAINIWEGCGLKGPRVAFRSLLNKNLVELEDVVDEEGVGADTAIRMHDHLRDLGRHLANNPSLPRRIWRAEDFEHLLQQSSVVTEVRGISMRWTKNEDPSFLPGFKIKNLQLLDFRYLQLESLMNAMQSPNLIWLRTDALTYTSLPYTFPLTNLRVLEVHVQWWWQPTLLWHEGWQAPLQLRELTFEAPLEDVPNSIGQLTNLERIRICWEGSTELPEEFCELLSLKHWKMESTTISCLPDSFGNLTNLKHIDLSGCLALERLPDSLGRLNKLTEFTISNCTSLCQLSFGICPSLKYLKIFDCGDLVEVGRLPDALIDLELVYCPNLRKLEWLSPLSKLQKLTLFECEKLEQLPSLETLVSLEELKAIECVKLRSIRGLAPLTKLRILYVWGCRDLEELVGVEQLRASECCMSVDDCPKLQVPEGNTSTSTSSDD